MHCFQFLIEMSFIDCTLLFWWVRVFTWRRWVKTMKFWRSVSLWWTDGPGPARGGLSCRCPLLQSWRWELLGGKPLLDFSSWWQLCCCDECCGKRARFVLLWVRAWPCRPYFVRFVFLDPEGGGRRAFLWGGTFAGVGLRWLLWQGP